MEDDPDLAARRESLKIPADLASCHIALADGYAFEGHIPAADVMTFLKERPAGALVSCCPACRWNRWAWNWEAAPKPMMCC
jgi:hypothetical protein